LEFLVELPTVMALEGLWGFVQLGDQQLKWQERWTDYGRMMVSRLIMR